VLSLPVTYAVGQLTLAQLYVVAFVVGTFDVTFAVAYQALLVSIVRRRDYLAANSLLNGSRSLAQVIGLALGGTLVGLLTAPGALVLNAFSFVVSGTQLARIHPPEPAGDTSRSHGIAGGVRWIRGNPVVRTMLLSTATINLFAFIGNAVLVLYASRTLGLSPALIGFVFGAGAIGGVIGAATFGRVERRLGLGRAVVFASFAFPLSMLLYPVAVLWLDISIGAVFAQEIPDQLRSRVAGAYRTVNYGVRPLGAILGGLLGAGIGLRNALWISAGGAICGAFLKLRPTVLGLRIQTDTADDPVSTD
jgi:predicted MFS family arabinose efflux permease